ncbi:MAG: putative Ig domain-containing protein, partial [Bacteriovoracaceae bacterium]|nr:putative Ig domain-containing protein [Bacteriovoracaceae bacterium]
MRTILHQILIIFIIVSYASCLPDSTTKWDKSKKTLSYDEDSLEGDDDSDDDDTTTTTLTDLEYSQNVIQLQLEINDTMDFDNIFVSDTTYYASTIDDVTFNRTIPKNKFPPSGSVSFNTNPIYVSSKPDDGETISARGVVTEINQNSKYVYVKVLYGTFHKDDLVSANYDYYSYQAKITKVTNFLTANQAMISLSPTIEPSSMASSMTYAVSPAFPAGMSVNYSTGVISGTPTEEIGREYTVSARNTSTGSSIESKMNFSITKDPSGLGVSNMLILVVNSTAAFRKFGYVSASKNCPDEIECSITRSDEEYPFGIIKEIISDTKMLVEVSMGEFKNYDLLDNNKVYANTETTVKHNPISVSVILTVDSPAAELDAFNYDVESTATDLIDGSPVARNVKKVVYATKDPLSAVGNAASGTEVTAWGKGVVAYFDSTPPSGTATRMYIMATEGNFIKDLDLYNSWTDTTTDRGDIEFVEAQNLILRIMPYTYSQPTNGCSDVAYTTRTTCLQNVGTCYDDTVAPPVAVAVVAPKQTNCQVAGHRWAPNYYAWVGIENFSAGMEVSNQPVATGNCLGDTGPLCDGVGFVTYVDATNNDLYIRTAGDNMFGSDHTGTGESIDNENIWVNPKAKVGTSRSTHHFNMYVNRYFSAYTSLFEGQNVTFSASPALPDGLTLNQESGVISGKPENSSARAEYIITAQNANSTNATSFTFSMTVHSHLS